MAGCFTTTASLLSCTVTLSPVRAGQSSRYQFPQGIASADPQPDAILLWTRVIDAQSDATVSIGMQLSSDQAFDSIIAEKSLTAGPDSDHTVRCFVDGLEADQWYYYRFITPDGYASRTGRTRTAPAPDADTNLNIAMFSCQNYESGYFNAYRRFVLDDESAPSARKADLCIHAGDFIYENVNGGSFKEMGSTGTLYNPDGGKRTAGELPSGGRPSGRPRGNQILPNTLDDYRHIYKSYLSDPALQAARAWYPFVYIWDDQEVLNDYWQAYHPGGSIQKLKVMGNQVWFEYMPAILSDSRPGPGGTNPAKDFNFVEVDNADPGEFDEDYLSLEPNTRAAINSMSIYRSLQWGTLADILLVDGRSYRGPRGLDTSILGTDLLSYPPAPIDPELIHVMNAGKTANSNNPPETMQYEGREVPNPRIHSPRGSMLGAKQKQWLKDNLTASKARWKLLINNLPMMRFGFDTSFLEHGHKSGIYWTDSWDGMPLERNEIMGYIKENNLSNVVSLTGDRHAHYAGIVNDDYDDIASTAVIPELAGAGVSALDRLSVQMVYFRKNEELRKRTGFDGRRVGYYRNTAPAMNAWFLYGEECAKVLSETANVSEAEKVKDPSVNPHMHFADGDAYGYYRVFITSSNMHAEFVTIPLPVKDESQHEPKVLRRVSMDIPSWPSGDQPKIRNIKLTGKHNFLGIKH